MTSWYMRPWFGRAIGHVSGSAVSLALMLWLAPKFGYSVQVTVLCWAVSSVGGLLLDWARGTR